MAELSSIIEVRLPAKTLVRAMLNKCLEVIPEDDVAESSPASAILPSIGAEWRGGIYAGLTLHENKPYALVLLPAEREEINWKEAIAWAEQQGGMLPSRIDQLVLWQNLKAHVQATWYWSCDPYAGYESSAWCQDFGYGGQGNDTKSAKLRARAVRRMPIE